MQIRCSTPLLISFVFSVVVTSESRPCYNSSESVSALLSFSDRPNSAEECKGMEEDLEISCISRERRIDMLGIFPEKTHYCIGLDEDYLS